MNLDLTLSAMPLLAALCLALDYRTGMLRLKQNILFND